MRTKMTKSFPRFTNLVIRAIREPLLHFLLIGSLIFVFYAATPKSEPSSQSNVITVTVSDAKRAADQFRAGLRRSPSSEDLDQILKQIIRDEVLVRQAEALSLDWNDPVIRKRLVQKMDALLRAAAMVQVPDDTALEAFMQLHLQRYQKPGQVSFEQFFLGSDVSKAVASAALEALNSGVWPEEFRVNTMLPQVMKMSDPTRIDSVFGTGVFAAIGSLRGDGWQGPLRTSFGVHLVRLTGRQAPVAPKLDKIRDVVLRDYIETQTKGLVEVSYQNLLSEFQIILPSPDEITEILQ